MLFTGILSAVLVAAGMLSAFVPSSALATIIGEPIEDCISSGNSALAQDGNNAAEQQTEQGQAGDAGAQGVSPEFNALTGNNLNLNDQQNGECIEPSIMMVE